MKTKSFVLLALIMTSIIGCKYDDDALWDKVNDLDNRVTSIENTLTQMNSDISTISIIVNALENKVYVSSVNETENGYQITFTDGKKITITNGKNGKDAPIISIDEFEGKYYWVQIVGESKTWLTDKDGNKIPVTGADGITPILRVNASGYWIISYDHGITFTELLDENNNPIKAVGKDGENGESDSWFDYVSYDSTTGILTIIINGESLQLTVGTPTGIPVDAQAGVTPVINNGEETFSMPTSISPISRDPNNANIGRFNLAGINTGGEWLELFGTNETNQNVWLEINGQPKSVKVINGNEVTVRSRTASPIAKAKADVIFLVDNSGSMSEEANKVAEEIIRWSQKLAQTMDVQFGCVGIDHYYINGALNITDVNTLSAYLNKYSGTSRTSHYGETMATPPADANTLKSAAQNYDNAGGECGGIMLHYADENFTFREGANRFYVYFTDEPNQPGNNAPWSVLSVKNDSEYYNWDASKGVIYTVFSDSYYNPHSWTNWLSNEDPTLFSTYTGGQILKTDGNFDISLDELPVTGAITQSFIFTFNITPDLTENGVYDITIVIYYPDGSIKSKYTYEGIRFIAS